MAGRSLRIDVLRAVAALSVLAFHTLNAWYLGAGGEVTGQRLRLRETWEGIVASPISLGFLGLNLFFVLSGLCIHAGYLALRERGGHFAYLPYLRRRFRRIYPAFAASIAVSLLLLLVAEWIRVEHYGAGSTSSFAAHWLGQTLRYLTFTHTLSAETFAGYNPPLYTMAIEVHFYLAYPIVLASIARFGAWRTLGFSVALSLAFTAGALAWGDTGQRRLILDSILVRWPEWIMGCLIAEAWFRAAGEQPARRGLYLALAGAACLAGALALQIVSGITPNLLWSGGIALIIPTYLVARDSPATRLEQQLARIGLYSYSIYLLHYPILRIAALLLPPSLEALALHALLFAAVAVAAVLAARVFSQHFERPFLSIRTVPGLP